jgi:hypothetical protein
MTLKKPDQDLKRDLQGIASDLKWSAVELKRIAERLSLAGNEIDAQAIHHLITIFKADEARLNARSAEISTRNPESLA